MALPAQRAGGITLRLWEAWHEGKVIWLLTSGRAAKVMAEMTGYSSRWISILVGRYNEAGVDGLDDQRRFNPGSRRMPSIRLTPSARSHGSCERRQTAARRRRPQPP